MAKSSSKFMYILLSIVVSAILYTIILWEPLGGWLLENVIVHVNFGFSNPNILEGLSLMLLCMILLVILFTLPFLFIWGIIIAILVAKKWREMPNN